MTGPCKCPTCNGWETCDECGESIEEESFEYGNDYICKRCFERHVDEGEAKLEEER